nr:MAG TPA: hypothetical protein [Caudoviricetes sp.]
MMRLMDWLKAFGEDTSADPMPATDQVMWFRLLLLDNSLMWREWFGCSDRRLQTLTGINSCHAITVAKNRLKQRGWLDFKAGTKKTTLYKITLPDYMTNGADVGADVGALNRLDKTRLDKTKKKIQKEKPTGLSLESYTQNPDLLEALEGFVEMRKKIKAPLTEHAFSLLLKKLDGMGSTDEEKAAIVNQSVMNSWKGLFPLKQEVRQHGTSRDNSREALEARYPDFVEADKDHRYPWEVRPPGGGDRAASG